MGGKKWFGAVAVFLPATAVAQQAQPWPDLYVTKPVAKGWTASGEGIFRVADDRRASQLETRVQIGRQLSKRVTVWAGWVHSNNYIPHAPNTVENQAVEQLNWTVGAVSHLRLLARTRLEQRFISNADDTSWRFRQQIRLVYGFGGPRAPGAVLWTEPFFALNRTTAQHQTLDQLRTFAGLTIPVSSKADVEFGYLNQRIYRANDHLVNHAIPLIVNYRF